MLLLFFPPSSENVDPGPLGDILRMSTIRTRLVDVQEISGLRSGQIVVADLAPKYWEFDISVITMDSDTARRVQAVIESLGGSIGSFYLGDPRAAYPAADRGGVMLGASTVQIASLNSNNYELTLKGLPPGYKLTPGDMLDFDYGSPSKRALHRIYYGGIADGSGVTPVLRVAPHIEPGAAVDAVVTLIQPSALVKMVPGSFDPGVGRQNITSGMGFKCRQVPV